MIHFWSFVAGMIFAFLASCLFIFGIMLYESRAWTVGDRWKHRCPFRE